MNPTPSSVLVVDDNEENRDVLARHLKRLGQTVVVAENGYQALELMRAQEFDLVLLDIIMPKMDGYQVLEHIRSDPALRHIPVLVISAVDDLDSVVRCIELGAEDHLSKPFNPVLLKARIGASLEKKRLRDQERAHLEELSVMQRIDRELNATLDMERTMHITLEWAMHRSGADAGLVGVVEEGGVRVVACQGYSTELAPYIELPTIQKAIQSGQSELLAAAEARDGAGLLAVAQSQVVVPIRREAKVVGVLLLESVPPDYWTDKDLAFLDRLSDHAAVAISNAQLYAAVQAANVAKSDFVGMVSHELRTPMTTIRGFADMLAGGSFGPVTPTQMQFLDIIRSSVDRMTTLVTDLTDISRIEAGRLYLQRAAVPVAEVVEEVIRSFHEPIEEAAQTLTLRIPGDLPLLWVDHTRLVQILSNLVSNAHKYTPRGGQITICAARTFNQWDPHGVPDVVHIFVQDTGIGIQPEDQSKVFQKFFRADEPKARQIAGTGLGLNITKYLVEMQGGRIWFESELDKGTTFHFTVPVAEAG
jgi:signal transduction histidine kinase